MTSLWLNLIENVNLYSSYEGLSPHQIWFNLDQGQQSYGRGGGFRPPPGWECIKSPRWDRVKVYSKWSLAFLDLRPSDSTCARKKYLFCFKNHLMRLQFSCNYAIFFSLDVFQEVRVGPKSKLPYMASTCCCDLLSVELTSATQNHLVFQPTSEQAK